MNTKNAQDIIIFGGHGDLALRKLIPALYHLCQDGHLNADTRIIAVSREALSTQEYCSLIKEKFIYKFKDKRYDENAFENFSLRLEYLSIDLTVQKAYKKLTQLLEGYEERERINYLSTAHLCLVKCVKI